MTEREASLREVAKRREGIESMPSPEGEGGPPLVVDEVLHPSLYQQCFCRLKLPERARVAARQGDRSPLGFGRGSCASRTEDDLAVDE